MTPHPYSKEGMHFQNDKVTEGLYTEAAIQSTKDLKSTYDVIVIGAGFTGLTAARDLSTAGKSVLLIEARDRIGGRTWASKSHGHYLEMGGTWVYWTQPHVWSELKRYGFDRELKQSTGTSLDVQDFFHKAGAEAPIKQYLTQGTGGSDEIMEAVINRFLDIDTFGGSKILSRPYDADIVSQIPLKYLKMTAKDRLDELTDFPEEHKLLAATIFETIGVAPYDKTPFFECLRWFGLAGWSLRAFWQSMGALNLTNGTTSLALAIMRESRADILLSSPISSVSTSSGTTTVTTRSGQVFQAPQVISTLPVNCLGDVVFTPAIDAKKLAAAKEQHLTKVVKMHTYTKATLKPTMTSATGAAKIAFGFTEADVHGPETGTFSVFFGSETQLDRTTPSATFLSFKEGLKEQFVTDRNTAEDVEPEEMFWHDWTNDEFAKGAWCTFPMGWQENYLDALRRDEHGGAVIFASADWADGWRGFIDGAFEAGRAAAWKVLKRDLLERVL
ncbi:putative flavin-containing amine oxidase [Hyaloscypha variabilis F]|uniref:Amine oxidase n=1 Tax=Hyaloscypha variabilis (strain UAMH 11265 / GT02V1 / F) TaxID=1149755 RepID=A0A2J6R4C3_HYAVF|nr:putative flavin-containing amine oxidase [Hyaloscypha variabilis F]